MENVFLVCFFVGLFFTLVSFILAGVFGGHGGGDGGGVEGADVDAGGVDVAGGDVDAGGVEVGHDFDHAAAESGAGGHAEIGVGDAFPGLSPWSPTIVCSFLATFGGVGYMLLHYAGAGLPASLLAASAAGLALAAGVLWIMNRIFAALQSSSEVEVADVIGTEAEVITPIPEGGTGEISYVARGTRLSAPAKSLSGLPIPRATRVKIQRLAGTVYIVVPV